MIHNYKLYIFGSRAKNRAKKYSDIDLAIDSQELTPQKKSFALCKKSARTQNLRSKFMVRIPQQKKDFLKKSFLTNVKNGAGDGIRTHEYRNHNPRS